MSERRGRRHAPAEELLDEWLAHRAAHATGEAPPKDATRDVLATLGVEPVDAEEDGA